MKLNIVTPLTRPENLSAIHRSIFSQCHPDFKINWFIYVDSTVRGNIMLPQEAKVFFTQVSGIAGHVHRNTYLVFLDYLRRLKGDNEINGWNMFLDDDNILHPDFFSTLSNMSTIITEYSGLIFDQCFKNGETRLNADPDNVRVGNVDTAQYIFRGNIVGSLLFDETRYDADGVFIEELYRRHREKFLIVNQPLCYYNYLRS